MTYQPAAADLKPPPEPWPAPLDDDTAMPLGDVRLRQHWSSAKLERVIRDAATGFPPIFTVPGAPTRYIWASHYKLFRSRFIAWDPNQPQATGDRHPGGRYRAKPAAPEPEPKDDAIVAAVRALMATQPEWSGTATELHEHIPQIAPHRLGARLREAAPLLIKIGIAVSFERASGRERRRIIRITRQELRA